MTKAEEQYKLCLEHSQRLTAIETELKFLKDDTLARQEKKLDSICNILKNGLSSKVQEMDAKLDKHLQQHERPKDEEGEPVERRSDLPIKRRIWKDWQTSTKVTVIIMVILNFPILYQWIAIVWTNLRDIIISLANLPK